MYVPKCPAGEGILFSYYPQSTEELFDSPSEMRIAVLSKDSTTNFLQGKYAYVVATDGDVEKEAYDRRIKYSISNEKGLNIMMKGALVGMERPNYHLILHNCDTVATNMFSSGGIYIEQSMWPNETYKNNK